MFRESRSVSSYLINLQGLIFNPDKNTFCLTLDFCLVVTVSLYFFPSLTFSF